MHPRHTAVAQIVGIALALAYNGAAAQTGFYGGIGAGYNWTYIHKATLTVGGATSESLDRDRSSFGGKVFGGYNFNSGLAVEGGYVDLGKFKSTRDVTAPAVGSLSATGTTDAWFVDVVGSTSAWFDGLSVIGKIGAYTARTNKTLTPGGALAFAAGTDLNPTETNTNLKLGAGAQWDLNRDFSARAEWEHYNRIGEMGVTGQNAVEVFSVNLLYRFR